MLTLRTALRSLRSAPLISIAAIVSLALGIGATATIFAILNGLLLKPLPVPAPQELVVLTTAGEPDDAIGISYPMWQALQERHVLPRAFAVASDLARVWQADQSGDASLIWATGDMFDVLGVHAALGRTLQPADDVAGGEGPVAVISDGYWQRQFGGAPDVIGRSIAVGDDRLPVRIVGVTPRQFQGLNVGASFDLILPLQAARLLGRGPRLDSPTWTWLQVMARRSRQETVDSLDASVRTAYAQIRAALMPDYPRDEDRAQFMRGAWRVQSAPGGISRLRREYGRALGILLAFVTCVLVLACTNIAGLLLARARARRDEFSVRRSLGASWWRLCTQQMTETALLAAAGTAGGLLIAAYGSRALVAQLSTWASTAVLDLAPDWRFGVVALAATLTTAFVCGIVPTLSAIRAEPLGVLRPTARGVSQRYRGAAVFVLVQVALSTMLVIGAGLFLRSFIALAYRDIGIDRDRVLVAVLDAGRSPTPAESRPELFERVRAAVAAIPGAESAATSLATPIGSAGVRVTPLITVAGTLPADGIRMLTNPVSPGWFRTYGTRMLAGRDFTAADRRGAPPVVIVNEAFAARYLTGNPVGQTITEVVPDGPRVPLEIVGVVQNAAFASVRDPIPPTLYAPLAQRLGEGFLATMSSISISVRTAGQPPAALASAVAAAVGRVDARVAVSTLTVREQVDRFYIRERLLASLSAFFGGFALILAGIGLCALIMQTIGWRRGEIGIRLALGARPRSVQRLLLADVGRVIALGIVAGVVVSFWAARLIGALLYGITLHDVRTFVAAVALLILASGLAAWWPARRASRRNPAAVLRDL